MADKRLSYEVELDTTKAQRSADELGESLEDSFEGAETAGKELARAIEAQADAMIVEIDATAAAVRAMDQALEGVDLDATQVVSDLKRMGLSAEEVEADAEALADALRSAGRVEAHASAQGFDDLGQAVDGVRAESERANDATRGFLGGMVGDSAAAVTGIGPLGESISQLTEGIAEGEVAFKQLAGAALGLGAIAVVFSQIQSAMEDAKAVEVFDEQLVAAYVDGLEDANDEVEAIAESLRQVGEIQSRTLLAGDLGWKGWKTETKDVTESVHALGMTVEQFARLVQGGKPVIDEWKVAMREAGADGEVLEDVLVAAGLHHVAYVEATRLSEINTAVFAETVEETTNTLGHNTTALATQEKQARKNTIAAKEQAAAAERVAEQEEKVTRSLEQATQAMRDREQATIASFSSELAYRNAVDDTATALDNFNEELEAGEIESGDLDNRLRDLESQMLNTAAAAVRVAEDQAKANGETLSGDAATQVYIEELERLRGTLDPGSALMIRLSAYINELRDIPRSITTTVDIRRVRGADPRGDDVMTHTGSSFMAGQTKDALPGQVFVAGGGPFTAPTAGRMLSQSESANSAGGTTIYQISMGDVYGTPDPEWVRQLANEIELRRRSVTA